MRRKSENISSSSPFIEAFPDKIMFHDGSGVIATGVIEENDFSVKSPDKVIVVFDHYSPPNTINASLSHKKIREFIKKHKINNFYDCGEGVCHEIMAERGHVIPGELIFGGDSHTTSAGALGALATGFGATEIAAAVSMGKLWLKVPKIRQFEVYGEVLENISGKDLALEFLRLFGTDEMIYQSMEIRDYSEMTVSDRFSVSNMGVEMGAKFTVFIPDKKTFKYQGLKNVSGDFINESLNLSSESLWEGAKEIYVPETPLVSLPGNPGNVKEISCLENIRIDQAVIGSCTGGKLPDLRQAAAAIGHNKVKARTIIIPASRNIYLAALEEGLIERFVLAGCQVLSPSCGPCMGAHLGLLSSSEVAISTTNRNFSGRMGAVDSEIYLANAWVAGKSAVAGKIDY